jgi:(1->4)-alpha-D-glucan 1-alpha-D-glucosylmutase
MSKMAEPVRIPVATYRLQFNARFTFRDALGVIDYLDGLGISDCYSSSYLCAVPGSGHGYDVADPTRLNPEIGTDEEYWTWIRALKSRRMGHVIDIVPNHMGIAKSANPWWLDVLENGPSSRYARFFDIEWHPIKDELADKLLIPVLGDQYGATLERGELRLTYADGAFTVEYYDNRLPVAPDTFPMILAPGLDAWTSEHAGDLDATDVEELWSIVTAAGNLPSRSAREASQVAIRAREKEVVKRRLAAVLNRSASLARYVGAVLDGYNGRAGQPRSFDVLDQLLNAQSYRLAHWRVASEEINYRRFFDVNQLAALRMEDPAVFDDVHRFVFELFRRGAATGFRIDHVDGLFAPGEYLQRLQEVGNGRLFIVVEKILAPGEALPTEWPVHGTTGYEFAAAVNGLFVEGRNARAMDAIYSRFIHERRDPLTFDDLAYHSKKQVMHETMSGDINSLGHQLNRFSERNRHFRDFTLYSLISTLKEVIACFPVYRTYVSGDGPIREADRRYIAHAVRRAKQRAPGVTGLVFDFVEQLLLRQTQVATDDECHERARFIGKFQQITSPVAAKGIEDTALYVYNRLLSLNEVGSDPTRFGHHPAEVHSWMAERQRQWPSALSATATHDTKRGEDVRARLNVLSELPDEWKTAVTKWRALNRRFKCDIDGLTAPDPNEEYFIYQTLVGAWPFESRDEAAFHERMKQYMIKALREAKVHSSWLRPDENYEAAVLRFIDAILDPRRPFLDAFRPFQSRVAEAGIYNSLSQLAIKIGAPGVPDFYQGTELWDMSLVDPDNRRPVDYTRRKALHADISPSDPSVAESLLQHRLDGRVKLMAIARGLSVRRQMPALFERGDYIPLPTTGAHRERLFAFARVLDADAVVVCVPRLVAMLPRPENQPPVGAHVWEDTQIDVRALPDIAAMRDAFTEATTYVENGLLDVGAVLGRFPVAMLVGRTA